MGRIAWAALAVVATAGLLVPPALADHGDAPVRVNAGAPGWDHSFPFIAEKMGYWKKYGLKVEFLWGSFVRNRQMMSIGDYEAGYAQISDIMRYIERGIKTRIVASTTAGAATLVGAPGIKSVRDLKGKTIAVVSLKNVQYLTLVYSILPSFGLSRKDVKLVRTNAAEVAALVVMNQVQAAFPFEPYGTHAVGKGATLLLDWNQIHGGRMFRNSLSITDRIRVKHPDIARKLVWAHLDALDLLRKDPEKATDILASYAKRIDRKLTRAAYDRMGLAHSRVPEGWIDTLAEWNLKAGFAKRRLTAAEVTDYSFQKGHPAADK